MSNGLIKPLSLPASWVIGWREIDEDHEIILQVINGCIAAYDGTTVVGFEDEFKALRDRVRGHFDHEERFMEHLNYPGLRWHHAHHRKWLEHLDDLRATCSRKGYADYDDILVCYDQVLSDIVKADLVLQSYLLEIGFNKPQTRLGAA
ncbi:hemerythrin family protein [Marivibrio halodurans]|uniref:Hemerythrin family protein n=1 Tax=Marivibrio halodurans TaxID=2039722 RepID=A0A8J7S1H7_9PROT|nr:hemerythrin family protein [Marivibrio halodurans]MBP5856964.1 hemerythrin family protein [Marivibrio halodurans]